MPSERDIILAKYERRAAHSRNAYRLRFHCLCLHSCGIRGNQIFGVGVRRLDTGSIHNGSYILSVIMAGCVALYPIYDHTPWQKGISV